MNIQDEGMGGSYAITADGERELLERTAEANAETTAPPDPPAAPIPTKPVKAGFFTPVTPAAPDDTTNHTTE